MEIERFNGRAKVEDQVAEALVLDLAEAFERVSLPVVGLGDAFQLPKEDLEGAVRLFRAPEASAVGRMRGGAAPDHHGHLARVQVELFTFTHCSARCVERSHIYPSLKLRVFVDDITALVKGSNEDVAEVAKKVMKKSKEEVEKKGLKLSVTDNGKVGKSKVIASCGFLENELSQFSKEEGVTLADSVETLGVDLRTRVERLGAKEKARRKTCMVRFSSIKKNKAFQKNYMEVGVKKLLRAGMMPARTWGVHAVGVSLTERLKLRRQMAAAAGKKNTTSLSFEVEEELSTMATEYWSESVWTGTWRHELKEAWVRQIREVQTWKQVRRPAGAVMCETRDLGIKRPYWHTLIFGNDIKIDMRLVCPKEFKKSWCRGPDQCIGRSGQPSTSMLS